MRWILACLLPLLLIPVPCLARTWHVLVDGSGDAPTIQAGIDSSAVGDTVLVAPGTYHEAIDFLGKDIVVKSSSGAAATIIDGSGLGYYTVSIQDHETRAAILQGFTVTGGLISASPSSNPSPSVLGNTVSHNHGNSG